MEMPDEVDVRQAKCRRDYKAIVKQCRQMIGKMEEKNKPHKRQKRSTNSEAGKAAPGPSDKMGRKELEDTIRGYLQELD